MHQLCCIGFVVHSITCAASLAVECINCTNPSFKSKHPELFVTSHYITSPACSNSFWHFLQQYNEDFDDDDDDDDGDVDDIIIIKPSKMEV